MARGLATSVPSTDRDFASKLLGRIKAVNYDEPEEAVLDLAAFRFLAEGASQIDLRAPNLEDVPGSSAKNSRGAASLDLGRPEEDARLECPEMGYRERVPFPESSLRCALAGICGFAR